MKWLDIPKIKMHSRIDYDCEDALLELYGEAAEMTILNLMGRTYEEVVEKFGTEDKPIPAPIIQASLIIVDNSYQYRTAASPQQLYTVPYTVDALIAPYVKHHEDRPEPENE